MRSSEDLTDSRKWQYDAPMPKTDRRDRDLKQFLQAEILNRDMTIEELYEACDLSKGQFYGEGTGSGRRFADDFPNTEELRHVADRYQLGDDGYVNLLVEFGWLESRPDRPGYTFLAVPLVTVSRKTVATKTTPKLSERKANPKKPPI